VNATNEILSDSEWERITRPANRYHSRFTDAIVAQGEALRSRERERDEMLTAANALIAEHSDEATRQHDARAAAEGREQELRDALALHEHTDECLRYAAKTGKSYCIAPCADSRRALLGVPSTPEPAPIPDDAVCLAGDFSHVHQYGSEGCMWSPSIDGAGPSTPKEDA
jgi:hypothetical protein